MTTGILPLTTPGKAKRLFCAVALIVCVVVCSGDSARAVPPVFEKPRIHLAAFDYPPFYFSNEAGVSGIGVDLVHELFGRMGLDVDIEMYPLKRALQHLRSGTKDGIMVLIKTPSRQQFLDYTDPVMSVRGLLWAASDRRDVNIDLKKPAAIRHHTIGVTRGYSYGHAFDEFLKGAKVEIANSDLSNFRKLVSHRVDIFPCNEIVAKGLFKLNPELSGRAVHSDDSFIEWVLHMGISKQSPLKNRIPEINGVLARLKEEGFIEETVRKYTR